MMVPLQTSMKENSMKTALFAAAGLGLAAAAGLPSKSDTLPAPPTQPAYVAHKPSCDDTKLSIYFPAHESMLSSYAIRALNATGDSLSGCAVTNIDVSVVSSDGAQAADRGSRSNAPRPCSRPLRTRAFPRRASKPTISPSRPSLRTARPWSNRWRAGSM